MADVVTPPPEGYTFSAEIGGVDFVTEVTAKGGVPCDDPYRAPCAVVSVAVEWAPDELPVQVTVVRDRRGYQLAMLSRLADRKGGNPCWSMARIGVTPSDPPPAVWRRLSREFRGWAATCSTVRAVGMATVSEAFAARRRDFERGIARLARARGKRLGERGEDVGVGVGSFLPTTITQRTLDAVVAACVGTGAVPKLRTDRTIEWRYDGREPFSADHIRPASTCINDQIKYFPGYPKDVSLFDGSNAGLELAGGRAFSVQYHPEASPGPQDSFYLFERFVGML